MGIVQWILFIMTLIPKALEIVVAIETQVGAGNGTGKKQIAVDEIKAIANASGASPEQVDKAVSIVSPLIDLHVQSLNAAGVFKRTPVKV